MNQHLTSPSAKSRPRWYARRGVKILAAVAVLACLVLAVATEYLLRNAAPILRKRIIETLSARFNAPVELDTLDISLLRGIEVTGAGLRVPYGTDANSRMPTTLPGGAPGKPHIQLSVDHFTFRSTLRGLLHSPTRIATVYVDGVTIDLPPGQDRTSILGPSDHVGPADPTNSQTAPKIALIVSLIRCTNVKLIIETSNPIKQPHEFDIQRLVLHKLDGPMQYTYDAQLTNPVPRGEIHATGHLGPWNINQPRQSPIDGDYSFLNADLGTIKGIGGTLTSTGHFAGVLERIAINGTTDTPDFSLDISNHPEPLHTLFHAFVDGTTGDTTLEQLQARLDHSEFTCSGTVMNIKGKGHDIALTTLMPHGHIEDLIELGMKSSPPLLTGIVNLRAMVHIPPGKVRIAQKLQLAGQLSVTNVQFTKSRFQDRIDGLSMRAQGKPEEAGTAATDHKTEIPSELGTKFTLANGEMTFNEIRYKVPGALVLLDGVDSLDGNQFEFKGHVRTDATASQMVTGWKRMLLRPLDPFLSRNGAGVELPISVSGQRNDVHLGLAFNDADETTTQMSQDLKTKRQQSASKPKPR